MLSKTIQLLVLFIYITTSSLVVSGSREDNNDETKESKNFIENLLSCFTIPVSDDTEDNSGLPVLFKDPSDKGSIVIDYNFIITTLSFNSGLFCLYSENDREDPFKDILSPPPQSIL